MEFRRFSGYDPYDYDGYFTGTSYNNPYDLYYQRQPVPTRRSKPVAAKHAPKARDTKTSFSIPIHGPDSDLEPEPKPKPERERKAAARTKPVAPAMSAEEATARMQAAARGFLTRKSVRAVREVEREAEQVQVKMASEAEAMVAHPRARLAVGEALMRMVLRLDAVRGARDYRRRVTKRVLALQDVVDAFETRLAPAPAPTPVGEETEAGAPEATAIGMLEENVAAPELPDAVQCGSEMESIEKAVHTPTQVEVDEAIAAAEPEAGEEKEEVLGDVDVDEPEGSNVEDEWEMVTEESEHAAPMGATPGDQEPPCKEPACPLETTRTTSVGPAFDGVDARKMMEMVAALCEQNTKQAAVISALAERVDALERTVRLMSEPTS